MVDYIRSHHGDDKVDQENRKVSGSSFASAVLIFRDPQLMPVKDIEESTNLNPLSDSVVRALPR
jgi:hypothetical protein